MPRLTDKLVAKIPFPDKGQTVTRDSDLRGFFVRTGKKSKSWTIQIDVTTNGQRRTVTRAIGDAATLGATEARTKAMATIAAIKAGEATRTAPEPREPEPTAPCTLGEGWESYAATLRRKIENGTRSAVTLDGYRFLAEVVLGEWHGEALRDLATPAGRVRVAEWHETITAGRGKVLANRSMALLRSIYRHASDFDLDEELPAKGPTARVELNREGAKQKGLTGAQLPEWNRVRLTLPNMVRREFHWLCLLTGLRTGSLKTAKWEDLDLDRRVLHIPRPKGGADRAYNIPVSDAILEALDRVKVEGEILNSRATRTWIFPSDRLDGHLTTVREGRALKLHDFAFGHRLRRAYKTFATLAGVNEIEQMILLNHASGNVSRAYVDRPAMDAAMLAAQEKISRYILEAITE